MDKYKIIKQLKEYFDIRELVSKPVFQKYGEAKCWSFFDTEALANLLWFREHFDVPITINSWMWGGKDSHSGLRENTGPICKGKTSKGKIYLSGHVLGKGFDCDFEGISAVDVRKELAQLPPGEMPPFPMRLERNMNGKPINWVHWDTCYSETQGHIYMFDIS